MRIPGATRIRRFVLDPLRIILSNGKSRAGLIITVSLLLLVTVGRLFVPLPKIDPSLSYRLPSWRFPLGTDALGENILGEIIYGGPFILEVAFWAALISVGVGTVVGLSTALVKGKTESVLVASTDVVLTIPGIILIIVLAQFFKPSNPLELGAMLSLVGWASFARVVRSQILTLRNQPFVEAARLQGLPKRHIIFVELLPNVMPYVAVNFIFNIEISLFASVGLYYLGVLPYSALNWGTMINSAVQQGAYLTTSGISSFLTPLLTITIFTVGLILLSSGFEEIFNPRLRVK